MPTIRWTPDRILLEIRRLHARGERLSARRMREIGLGGMVTTAYRLFGTWRGAIEAAGVEAPVERARSWSRERIVGEIQRLAAEGQGVSYGEVVASYPRLVAAAYRHPELGNWARALEAAGLDPVRHGRRRWSRQAIVEQIQAMADRGESLCLGEVRRTQPALLSAACSPRYFGSWARAVSAAGLDYGDVRRRQRWSPERIVATIKHLHEQGVPLSTRALQQAGWGGLVAAARRKTAFGSWRDAVECAGIDYEQAQRRDGMPPAAAAESSRPAGETDRHAPADASGDQEPAIRADAP